MYSWLYFLFNLVSLTMPPCPDNFCFNFLIVKKLLSSWWFHPANDAGTCVSFRELPKWFIDLVYILFLVLLRSGFRCLGAKNVKRALWAPRSATAPLILVNYFVDLTSNRCVCGCVFFALASRFRVYAVSNVSELSPYVVLLCQARSVLDVLTIFFF